MVLYVYIFIESFTTAALNYNPFLFILHDNNNDVRYYTQDTNSD